MIESLSDGQVLNQEETPFLYSLLFGEGAVKDATSVVIFNAIKRFASLTRTPRLPFSLLAISFHCLSLGVFVTLSLSLSHTETHLHPHPRPRS